MFADFTPEESQTVHEIVNRAAAMYAQHGTTRDKLEIRMDISAAHYQCPLRLDDLLAADDFNFAHDITGIANNINRVTGELENCFLPRFARPKAAA